MSKYIYIFLITTSFFSINYIARGVSFYSRYQFPPVERMPAQNQGYKLMQASQVMNRLHSLPKNPSEIEDPYNYIKALSEKILHGVDHLLGENSQNDINIDIACLETLNLVRNLSGK
jgi:hypothetical protein